MRRGLEAARLSDSTPPPHPPAGLRTSPEPVPDITKPGEKRGRPHTAPLRHEFHTLPGTLGQGQETHSLYLTGLFCPAEVSKASIPLNQPLPWSHQSGLEGGVSPFFSLHPCLFRPLSSVLRPSLFVCFFFSVSWSSRFTLPSLVSLVCLFVCFVQCPCLS